MMIALFPLLGEQPHAKRLPKQYRPLRGEPLMAHTLCAVAQNTHLNSTRKANGVYHQV